MATEKQFQISDQEAATVYEVDEYDPRSRGEPGTFNVNRSDFGNLESQTAITGIEDEDQAETLAQDFAKATQRNRDRSARSRALDDEFDAPLTTDYDTWASDPDHYDFPGVDSKDDTYDADSLF